MKASRALGLSLTLSAVAACAGDSESSRPGAEPRLVVHEWGTYTSTQSSTGATLYGMHHEEEALPDFVHNRRQRMDEEPDLPPSKGIEALPEPISQKLETPVIYFYGDEAQSVRVDVDFPDGVITEWYPSAATFAPEVGGMAAIEGGRMRWDVEVAPPSAGDDAMIPPVGADSIWAPSRDVDAATVRVGTEADRFIFYRGLGMFDMSVRVTASDDEVSVANEGDAALPAAFVLNVHAGGASISALGPIAPGEVAVAGITPKELDLDGYLAVASDSLVRALEDSGLTRRESEAMVGTWERSYFLSPGVRVLYVAPRSWTDRLLPISIDPEPDELVRTLIGRVEVLTPADEADVVARVEAHALDPAAPFDFEALGRLAEPKLRRALDLIESEAARWHCQALIEQAVQLP